MADTTTRFAVVEPSADRSDPADVPYYVRQAVSAIERSAMFGQGLVADRPVSSGGTPGIQGRLYASTDESPKRVYYDYGTGWFPIGDIPAGSITSAMIADGTIVDADISAAAALSIGKLATKFCFVSASGTSVSDDTLTAIALDGETYDNDTMHDSVTNNTRITCKTAGYYLFFAMLQSSASYPSGSSQTSFYKNGSVWAGGGSSSIHPAGDAYLGAERGILLTVMQLAVNDYIEVKTIIHGGDNPSIVVGYAGAMRVA